MNAIETHGLKRRFKDQWAVDGVDIAVPECSVYGFLGENGAGKTTTIRLLLGLLKPTAGTAAIFRHDVARERRQAARLVGALVETPSHYDHLTGRENLDVTRRLLGCEQAEIDRVLEIVDLAAAADRGVGGYSLGMRQRLGVARALLGRPKVLILDEPTNGLDPNGIRDMRSLIAGLPQREGVTVLVSSHVLAEVEQFATHLGLMHRGRLLTQGTIGELKARQARTIRFEVDRLEAALSLLSAAGVRAEREGGFVTVLPSGEVLSGTVAARLNALLVGGGLAVSGVELIKPSLEQLFVSVVGAEPAAPELAIAA
ncbi:MAG TPA: ABC transporter ATP-binding protein [Sphingomicrobium sp.]